MRIFAVTIFVACAAGWAVAGEPVGITPAMTEITVPTADGDVSISRVQDNENRVDDSWTRTSRACPPFCVQPMTPAEGVTTIGELELLEMLVDPEVLVVDSRVVEHFIGGSIPGAVSIPYNEVTDRLDELGCEIDFDGFDCQAAKTVALFCNGPWCGQSPSAARNMIAAGYPAERIFYYRGGMQNWRMLGLTVTK
ncbi:sulfurtransferase [Rhodobacterales bacterium 56_14_T64]|nr:sulfurtransferase [Rhodobacterales bacterium 56_14_T64]